MEVLGIEVDAASGKSGYARMSGWNEAERDELKRIIAARQPFLDYVFHRIRPDGTQQAFRVSGEPTFNQSCRFTGYRGVGVEITSKI